MSNELEFGLHGVDAAVVIDNSRGLEVVHEVNPNHVLELNISLAETPDQLNVLLRQNVRRLIEIVETQGGTIYAGSSLIEDVSEVQPKRHRTTSLSEACAHGFLDITSQQVVLGVNDEALGFELYNMFRRVNPALLALSASSPYRYVDGSLKDTEAMSRRLQQYVELCRFYPHEMWRTMPKIGSMSEYYRHLQQVSDEVNKRLARGELDANVEELTRIRTNGFSYIPFSRLEPHQIYWYVRPRPDHSNERSVMSVELRVTDIPTTVERMQLLNSFVVGLAYYVADHGSERLPLYCDGTFEELEEAAKYGLDTKIGCQTLRTTIDNLTRYARDGLEGRSLPADFSLLDRIFREGTDAEIIRNSGFTSPQKLISYLVERLKNGE